MSGAAEAAQVKAGAAATLAEVALVQTALALPILEPLTAARVEKAATLSSMCRPQSF